MTPLVIGTPEDVAGFALAGVDGVVCATPAEAEEAIARAAPDALVIVSAGLAAGGWRLAGDRLVVSLPGGS